VTEAVDELAVREPGRRQADGNSGGCADNAYEGLLPGMVRTECCNNHHGTGGDRSDTDIAGLSQRDQQERGHSNQRRQAPVTPRRSRTMEPRLNVITLGVGDLERALVFYRDGLGLQTNGVVATDLVDQETGAAGAIVIFKLEGGLILALYPRSELAKDAAVPVGPPHTGQFSLGQLVASRAEVDTMLEKAAAAGAVVTPPHDRPWGIYSGYFRDPDGHLWEIIWNPPTENTKQ